MLEEVLGAQLKLTEWAAATTPVPETGIEIGEFVALLAMMIIPEKGAALVGVNTTPSGKVCPGATTDPASDDETLKPGAAILAEVIVTGAVPLFVRFTTAELLAPTATLPKFKLVTSAASSGAPGRTVSMAGLLSRLPAELLTVTEKIDPSSKAWVGGVTYDAEVAPGIITPFFCHWY